MAQVSVRAGQACKGPVVGCTLAGADPTAVEVFRQVEQASGEYLFDTCVSGAVLEQEVGGCGPVLKMPVEGWKRREIRCSCVYRGGLQEGLGGQAARWKAS